MKRILAGFGLMLMLFAFSSCSDDVTNGIGDIISGDTQDGQNGDYAVQVPHGAKSHTMVLFNTTGDVRDIVSSEDWLSAEQVGQDGEKHPVLRLSIDGSVSDERVGIVSLKSSSDQSISITVKQRGVSLMGSEAVYLPEVVSQNKEFYENWYEGSQGQVYITESNNSQTWMKRNLPWRDNSLGSVPADVAAEMRYHKDDWKLVYSTLGLESTSGANFFTLFNSKLSKLRFFYFIPAGYITMGSSAVFAIDVYNPKGKMSFALNSNEMLAMPDELQNSGRISSGTTQTYYVMPLGTREDRTITSGWSCFDLDADHGYTDATKEAFEDPDTKLTVRLVTTLIGNIDLQATLNTTGDIDMSGVKMVRKGSDLAAAATFFNGFGSAAYQVGAGIASCGKGQVEKAGGIVQIVGGGSTLVGTVLNTIITASDASQYYEGSASVNFTTKGSISGSVNFNTINGLPGITFSPVAFKYNWETLYSGKPTKWATDNTLPTFGLMNAINTPVVYVSSDHLLYEPAEMSPLYEMKSGNELIECTTGDDEQFRYISFLDPSSVEMFFNKEMMGYDFEQAQISVSLTANAGPQDLYAAPTPYYGYYQLRNDSIQLTTHDTSDDPTEIFRYGDTKSMKLVPCLNSEIPTIEKADDIGFNAGYKVSELPCYDRIKDLQASGFRYRYYGLTGELFGGGRKIIVDPVIYVPTNKEHLIYNKSLLGPLYVTILAQLTKSDGSMQIISKHYLPEIRTFKSSEIDEIKARVSRFNPTTVRTCKGVAAAEYIDAKWLKARALKMLELAAE